MKVTIDLCKAEYDGIKNYLKETSDDVKPKVTKEDISNFIKSELNGLLWMNTRVSDFVIAEEAKLNKKK